MIEKLTPKQTRLLARVRDEQIGHILYSGPTNRPAAEEAMRLAYQCGGLEPPQHIVWVKSPLVGVYTAGLLASPSFWGLLKKHGFDGGASLRASLSDSLSASLRDSLRDSLSASLSASLGASLRGSYWWNYGRCCGSWEWWLSYFAFAAETWPSEQSKKLDGLFALGRTAHLWWPYKHMVIMSDRPTRLSVDDRQRLHCADGQALGYSDGWGLYYWHGMQVPAKLVEAPESYTAADIKAESNSEIVRALAERLGWEAFVTRLDVASVDRWADATTGLAYELLESRTRIGDGQPRFLRMVSPKLKDGSQPTYLEPVHPDLTTAQAARRWQGVNPDGTRPTPTECNNSPETTYAQEA